MKKLFIVITLVTLASCTPPMVSQPTCDCEAKDSIIKVYEQQIRDGYYDNPTDPHGPYDISLTREDLELEGEFQDDTIGQLEY